MTSDENISETAILEAGIVAAKEGFTFKVVNNDLILNPILQSLSQENQSLWGERPTMTKQFLSKS